MALDEMLSFQLYSLRNYGGLPAQLALLREVGFRHVETVMSHYDDPAATLALLQEHGMTASSGHFSLDAVYNRLDWVAETAKVLGLTQIAMPAVPPDQRQADADAWRVLGRGLGEAAGRLHDHGITLMYHNHDWDLRMLGDGSTPLDLVLGEGEAGGLGWQADLAWVVRAGADPVAWMTRYADRLLSVHVKDLAPQGINVDQDGWADVGAGIVGWQELWPVSRRLGAVWMVVEHDNPKDFDGFCRRSFAYLETLGA